MPEGPEVRTIAKYLNLNLSGKTLVDSIGGIDGTTLKYVTCYGKRIYFVFNTYVMVSKLGMEGKWLLDSNVNRYTRMVLQFTDGTMVHYDDCRKLGSISVTSDITIDIGPDMLWYAIGLYGINDGLIPLINTEVTLPYYISIVRKYPKMPICRFLLDQSKFSGVGNYLKSEILYMSNIHPTTTMESLSDYNIEVLYWSTIYVMVRSYLMEGFTLRSYVNPYGVKGRYQPMVYGRCIDDYGNQVHRGVFQDGRVSYYI
jgi:formamidopyrimidine-DNA glycosylase